jgi:hypothetical protein
MSPNKKVLIAVLTFTLAMLVAACSYNSIIPASPSPQISLEAMPGLAGTWQDPQTFDTFVIAWVNNQYVVKSVVYEGTTYKITSQSWANNSLTWTYYIPESSSTLSYQTTSLSGDSLFANWWNDQGDSGTETLGRVH